MSLSSAHSEGWFTQTRRAAPVLRRPLLGLTLVFMLGLVVGQAWALSVPLLLACAFPLVLSAVLIRGNALATTALYGAVFCTGCIVIQLEHRPPAPNEMLASMSRDRERQRVIGQVVDDPVAVVTITGEAAWRFPVRVEAVERAGLWQRARGRLDVRWAPGPTLTTVRYGERWQFDGPAVRRVPEAGQAPVVWMSLRGDEAIRLGGGYGFWLRERCLEGRRSCGRLLARGLEDFPDQAGLLRAFMLGNREALPERAHRAFTTTGTLHIAAISGAHVVILAGLLLIPLKALGFSQTRWIYVMAPLLLLYALGTGLAASAVRACIMACVYWSAFAFRRRPDGPSSLALSALLILAVAPGQLWEAGFLLSFGVVAGLMVLVAPLSEPLLERLRPELPGRPTRRMQIRSAVARPVISLAVVSLAAWLVSLPMTAQYFNLFSPVGLVANLLVVPLASLILLTGCLTLTLGWVLPLGADIFNHANRVLVDLLLFLVDWFHRWPGGHLFVQAPPWWFAPCWYACLVALVRGRRRLRWAAGGLAVLALLVGSFCSLRENRVTLAATPLGRGMAVLVEGPRADGILVDPGPGRVSRDLVRWLHTRGVDRLQAVVLTRATVDTAGALPALIEQIPVRELWLPASPVRSPTFTALVEQARQAGLEIKRLGRGDAGLWPGGVTWQVLHPDRDHVYGNALQGSLVLRVSRGPASALIAGAARPEWQAELLAQPMDVAASGLLVTSWASGSSWSETWLAQVRPGWRVRPPGDEESDQAAGIFSSLDYVLMEDQTAQWWLSDDPNDPLSSGPATHLWR